MSYNENYENWKNNPIKYWQNKSEDIHWYKKPEKILDSSNPPFWNWFPDGELNTCYNCLDIHVENGNADRKALIYDSPVTQTKITYTYKELLIKTERIAGALQNYGVSKGDRVLIYMPMIPEAVASMLACARLGAIHVVVFGGFAPNELATRINDSKPKIIIAGSCGIEPGKIIEYKPMLDKAIEIADYKVKTCFIFQRKICEAKLIDGRDFNLQELINNSNSTKPVSVKSTDPLYILYTSGTTGDPKGMVRDNGGHAVALKNSMRMVYGLKPGEVFWAASDIGWVVGHSYIVYAPLLSGCTSILYEGKPTGTPDAGSFWRVISDYNVSVMFTAPTALRAIKRDDPNGEEIKKYNLQNFRMQFLAGERADPTTIKWTSEHLNVPVIDHWWQTETGWAIAGNFSGLDLFKIKPGSTGKASPGFEVQCLDDNGNIKPRGEIGALAIKLPLPPSCSSTLWQDKDRYKKAYLEDYPGWYSSADAGYIDNEGYIWVMSRTDDIINCAGHRLSTGAMEEVLSKHQNIAECAVVGVEDELKGQIPMGFIVINAGTIEPNEKIIEDTISMVRNEIGPVASFRKVIVVKRLPKTRSGKILRSTIASIVDKKPYKIPATIDDESILDEIKKIIK
ncbi:MAG: Acetyl-coenzyme A synthetase [Alphaproteobacteria bacterium MarineAlpha9_Bin3]|nr:MAG: Acetyl-coenzyme A synthetase [Alphaproteobacteria bacterium MarineAlpha9_Bin3]|tara:strand:+ start:37335 stop:39206 length:1872 start_codon:yes stop_codon:yes gene_type:complete